MAESLEEFDRWMRKDQGWLYVAKDCTQRTTGWNVFCCPAGDGRRMLILIWISGLGGRRLSPIRFKDLIAFPESKCSNENEYKQL